MRKYLKMAFMNKNLLILYKDDEGRVSNNVLIDDEDVWLTLEQLAQIYDTTQQNISLHVKNIYISIRQTPSCNCYEVFSENLGDFQRNL